MSDVHVTDAESAILEALWRCGPLPPYRLIAEVKARRAWGDATIKTLLRRLMRKRVVRSLREDGRLVYRPMIERQAFVETEVRALVDRLFGGDPAALAGFLRDQAQGD